MGSMYYENPMKSRWVYLERIKWVAEIVAIMIAGLWALKLYYETEVPAQEKRASVQGELQWTNKSAAKCFAEYTVTFKNVGKTSIELAHPRLDVWLASQPNATAVIEYLDPHKLMRGKPILTELLTDQEFARHYPPDVGDTVTMVVAAKRNPGRILMFSLDFPQSDPTGPHWLDYRWGYACEEPVAQTTKRSRTR